MANCLFLSPYMIDLATLAAASTASGLSVTNLQDSDPTRKWRSTSITSQYITIDFGATGATACNAAAFINTNLTNSATIRVRASNSSAGAVTSSPSLDVSGIDVYPGSKSALRDWTNHIAFGTWTNANSYRYWRIDFSDAGNSDGYLEAGRLMMAAYWQPSLNMDQSVAISYESVDAVERTAHNQLLTQRRGSVGRRFDLTFSSMDQDEAQDGAMELARLRGAGGDFFVSLDPTHTTRFPQWSMQGVFSAAPRFQGVPLFINGKQCWAFTCTVSEKL